MSQFRWNIFKEIFVKQLNVETAIAATTYYPASASFFDASPYERIAFLITVGALNSALTFQVRQDTSATATGSVKVVTGAVVVVAADQDNTDYLIEIDTSVLDTANGFHYVTLYATGAGGGDDYAAVTLLAYAARTKPVTQVTAMPEATHSASIVVG